MEENKKQSIYELLDFKVTDIETHIGQSLTAEELHLKMENRMGTRMSTEEEGVVFLYLNYRIYDGDDGKFLFDLSTQSVIRLPEGEKEVSEGNISRNTWASPPSTCVPRTITDTGKDARKERNNDYGKTCTGHHGRRHGQPFRRSQADHSGG